MSINYTEKRNFIRMETDHEITIQQEGSDHSHEGKCLNLSAAGVLFTSHMHFKPGTRININITPEYALIQPLEATIEVIRSQVHSNDKFSTAGEIKEFH